jgi:hypothetical protein
MTVQVLDSTDLTGILADAGVELDQTQSELPADTTEKTASEATAYPAPSEGEEDDNGLTAAQREELTAKMQKAIGKKHRALREAEEFAAAQYNTAQLAQRRAQELEAELARVRGSKAEPEAPKATAKPQRQDFGNESDYIDAMIQFGVEQSLQAKREQEAREAAERHQQEILDSARGRIQRAMELVPDFAEVTGAVDMEVPTAVAGYMQKSELFAELGYHLAKNPEVLVSLTKLAPDEQLVKIGKIESTLQPFGSKTTPNDTQSSQSTGKPKPAPSEPTGNVPSKARGNAAPVITPLDGTGSAGIQKEPADMNIREAIQDWQRKNGANLGRRQRH